MNLTTRELRLARKAALPFLPATLEDFKPTPRKQLVVGVYHHGNGFRANLRQPGGGWKMKYFTTAEEAAKARTDSLKTT